MESTWVVNWDNNLVGFVSAAGTKGSAVARFRAAGPTGDHVVRLLTGYQGQGYLNYEQSPVAHLPRPQFTFRTTPGRAPSQVAYAEPYQRQPVPKTEVFVEDASLTLGVTQGPVGMRTMLSGSGFPANASLAACLADLRRQPGQWQWIRAAGKGIWPRDGGSRRPHRGAAHDPGRPRRSARARAPRWRQDTGACLLRHRDQHRQHLADVRAGRYARDDSLERRRLDRIRQHLRGDLRQRLHGIRVRLQQPG